MKDRLDFVEWLEYAEYYPEEDEPGFDGVHYGGVKGVKADAPEWAKKAYEEDQRMQREGIKI